MTIREGVIGDYAQLARFHYRAAHPAVVVRVLVAEVRGACVGVLTVSMPPLEGRWRDLAWPGCYRSGDKSRDAAALNRDVSTISRVIVEPRHRGLGIATRLVRGYLESPLTVRTEALAAMGVFCPFFARAGMREWRLGPCERDARLIEAIERAGLEPWRLVQGNAPISAELERALRVWADASRVTRGMKHAGSRDLACVAAMAVSCRPVAYTAERV